MESDGVPLLAGSWVEICVLSQLQKYLKLALFIYSYARQIINFIFLMSESHILTITSHAK